MKYYKLNYNSLNEKITGTQFQSVTGIMGDIQQEFIPFEGKIDFVFTLPEPFLEKKAKLTTYLNVVMIPNWYIVLKDYFIEFLSRFNIGENQTWKLKVHQNNKIINDYSMFILNYPKQRELIRFDKSEFYIGKYSDFQYIGNTIKIFDYDDYLKKREKLNDKSIDFFLKYNKVVLDLSKIDDDFFRIINTPCSGYYVSERLKESIEEEKFTGFAFQEIEEMDKRIKVVY